MSPDGGENRVTDARPWRCGVLLPGAAVPEWAARCLRALASSPLVEPALVIRQREGSPRSWLEGKLLRSRALTPGGLGAEWASRPEVPWGGEPGALAGLRLDFVLNLGAPEAGEGLRGAARHGVWSFAFGPGREEGRYAAFRGICRGADVLEGVLEGSAAGEKGRAVLKRGVFKVYRHSYARTVEEALLSVAEWPAQACADLAAGRVAGGALLAEREGYGPPGAGEVVRFLVRTAGGQVARVVEHLFRHPHWNIGVIEAPITSLLGPGPRPPVRWLPEPQGGVFVADPFAAVVGGKAAVLYEEFRYGDWKGRICCVPLGPGAAAGRPCVALEGPGHMSYPYLFEHGGEVYCVPETHEAREVALYRAVRFPHEWAKVAVLLEGVAACDSTVFTHEGRWWMALTDYRENSSLKLFLYHAPELYGPWRPHAANPVKTDVSSARPAGTPFVHEGVLYRPAQDCSSRYGGRVVLNRVLRLTPAEFAEEPAGAVEPFQGSRYPAGLHTVAAAGDITVVDGMRYGFSARAFRDIVRRRLRRVLGRPV
jgi:hypothetical protein